MAIKDPKYQGILHLLSIFFIPAILVAFFLAENIWIGSSLVLILGLLLFFIYGKKK